MPQKKRIGLRIDELTSSLKDSWTGKSFATDFCLATAHDVAKTVDWLFDWQHELKNGVVYKLFLKAPHQEMQGLVSVHDRGDHVWVNLAEAAPHNFGKTKRYIGVGGNLFAIAAKISLDKGYEGFIAFEAKTELISHYQKTLGAVQIGRSTRMAIASDAAHKLYKKYFNH